MWQRRRQIPGRLAAIIAAKNTTSNTAGGLLPLIKRHIVMTQKEAVMQRCECCGQIVPQTPVKKRGRWTFLKNLKAGEVLTFYTEVEKEQARDAARHYGIKYTSFKHGDGSGYSLIVTTSSC